MPVRTKIRRIGTSLGVILAKKELDALGLKEGDEVEIPRLVRPAGRDLFGAWRDRPVSLGGRVVPRLPEAPR